MKTRAAVLWGIGQDWKVEEIELDPPKAGEVLVKMKAAGLCHSDEHLVTGDMVLRRKPVPRPGWTALPDHRRPRGCRHRQGGRRRRHHA